MRALTWGLAILAMVAVTLVTLPSLVRDQLVIWLRGQGVDDARLTALEVDWLHGETAAARIEGGPCRATTRSTSTDCRWIWITGPCSINRFGCKWSAWTGLEAGYRDDGSTQWLGTAEPDRADGH